GNRFHESWPPSCLVDSRQATNRTSLRGEHMIMKHTRLAGVIFTCVLLSAIVFAQGVFTKGQVADRIRKVEDGVDEFRKWSENRGDQGKDAAQSAKASGRTRGRT